MNFKIRCPLREYEGFMESLGHLEKREFWKGTFSMI